MYKVGIIGCGRIASEFEDDPSREHPCTHAGAYSAISQTEIVCAADVSKSKLEKFSKKWSVRKVYSNYKEMLSEKKMDIISVCTPPSTHDQIVVDTAKSGVKAIFCEKPIATSIQKARKMVNVCKKYSVHLTVNHSRRWDINYMRIREILLRKEIGEIVKINGCYTSGLSVMGTHIIDLLRYFCGDVARVIGVEESTQGVNSLWYSENYSPTDPPVSGVLWFKNRVIGQLLASCKTQYPFFEIDVFTTRGRISMKEWAFAKYLIEIHKLKNGKKPKLHLEKKIFSRNNNLMLSAVKDIVNSLINNRPTVSTGEDALQTMMLMNALLESSAGNKLVKV